MTPFDGADTTSASISGGVASYPEISQDMEGLFGLGILDSPFNFESPDDFVFAGGCGHKESVDQIDFGSVIMQPEINISDDTLTQLTPFDGLDPLEALDQQQMPTL